MANNNQKIAISILEAVGGKDNIAQVAHCMTRLRLNLKDESILNADEAKKIQGVLGVQKVGAQQQFIIGQNVPEVYMAFCEEAGIQAEAANDELIENKKPKGVKGVTSAILDGISGCINPILPAITLAGLLKLIAALIGPSMLGIVGDTSDIYRLFNFAGDAAFYFFPILIGYSGAKKFGCNPVIAIVMGAIMIHPSLIEIVNAGEPFTVYGIPMTLVNYSNNVISMIMITWIMSYVEKYVKKIIPDMLKNMLVPLITILIMLPISLCALGPVGTFVGQGLAIALEALSSVAGPFATAIIAALWPLLVMTGMHQAIIAYGVSMIAIKGFDNTILLGGYISCYTYIGLGLGALIRFKNKEDKSMAFSAFCTQVLGGIGEPTLFGIMIRYKKAMVATLLAGFTGGFLSKILGAKVYFFGATNFLSFLSYAGEDPNSVIMGFIASIVAAIIACVFLLIFGIEDSDKKIRVKKK